MIKSHEVTDTNFYQVIGEIVRIMAVSDIHHKWTVSDIERMVAAPLFAQRALLYYDNDDGDLIAFVTFAFLDEESEQHHVNRTKMLDPQVFSNGENDGQLWFMEFIAPFGGVPDLMRHTKEWISEIYPNVTEAKYRRLKTGRIGRISAARPALMH